MDDRRGGRADPRVFGDLIDTLYRQTPGAMIAAAIALALFGAFERDKQPVGVLVPWLVLQYVVVAASLLLVARYFRRRDTGPRAVGRWAARYILLSALFGSLWGVGHVLFFRAADPLGNAFVIIFGAGVAATGLVSVSCYPPAFLAFTLLTLVPLVARCLAAGGTMYLATALSLIGYLGIGTFASGKLSRMFRRSAELRFQNEDLAQRLASEKERAERALLARSKVLAAASHDLRQPLHALGIFVELLEQRVRGQDEQTFVGRIRASSVALGGLLGSLLDVARLDSNAIQVRREHVFLFPLIDQLAAEYGEIALRKGLAFRLDAADDDVVETDPELLARMLRNLLSNAVRFTPVGEIVLRATRAGDVVSIAVADTGLGIPLAERAKVFEEFYQVANLERDREKGLGLGLAIVRGLGRLLDHPVRLRSQPERPVGTEVVIDVRTGDPGRAALAEEAASAPPASLSLAGRRVLVLDDERDIRVAMRALLESWGCEVLTAATVEEALDVAGGQPPDLVLCDYRLRNGLTGADAIARLQQRFGQEVASAIITGDTSPERIREAKSLGRPLLFKPVMPGKLRALLLALLPPPPFGSSRSQVREDLGPS